MPQAWEQCLGCGVWGAAYRGAVYGVAVYRGGGAGAGADTGAGADII